MQDGAKRFVILSVSTVWSRGLARCSYGRDEWRRPELCSNEEEYYWTAFIEQAQLSPASLVVGGGNRRLVDICELRSNPFLGCVFIRNPLGLVVSKRRPRFISSFLVKQKWYFETCAWTFHWFNRGYKLKASAWRWRWLRTRSSAASRWASTLTSNEVMVSLDFFLFIRWCLPIDYRLLFSFEIFDKNVSLSHQSIAFAILILIVFNVSVCRAGMLSRAQCSLSLFHKAFLIRPCMLLIVSAMKPTGPWIASCQTRSTSVSSVLASLLLPPQICSHNMMPSLHILKTVDIDLSRHN